MSLASYFVLNNYNYNLRNVFNLIFEGSIKTKLCVKRIIDNINFKEKYTDFLIPCSYDDISKLKDYTETTYDNYLKEYYNSVFENKIIKECNVINYKKEFNITEDKGIHVTFKDNEVLILDIETKRIIFNIKYNYKIIDFNIDEEGFIYICYEKNSKIRLIKTHINFNFFLDNKNHYDHINKLEEISKLFDIDIPEYKMLLNSLDEYIYYLDNNNNIRRIELCRKYYFYKDGTYFYNSLDKNDGAIQIEHLHIYDYISILGLNEFKYENFKISSLDLNKLNEILIFKFDSSLNGVINYFDFGKSDKSYKINKVINFIKITGNFNYNYEKGNYIIRIITNKSKNEIEANVTLELIKNNECIKTLNCNTVNNILYFCNLKFVFFSDEYNKVETFLEIKIVDEYPIKIKRNSKYVETSINHNDYEKLFSMQQVMMKEGVNKKQLVEVDYKNGELIVKDYVKNNKERYFGKDYKLRIVEEDGLPSLLWRKLEDKDYYFCFKKYFVIKKIKSKKSMKNIFNIKNYKFDLNIKDNILNNGGE